MRRGEPEARLSGCYGAGMSPLGRLKTSVERGIEAAPPEAGCSFGSHVTDLASPPHIEGGGCEFCSVLQGEAGAEGLNNETDELFRFLRVPRRSTLGVVGSIRFEASEKFGGSSSWRGACKECFEWVSA